MGAVFAWGARHFDRTHDLLADLAVPVAEAVLARRAAKRERVRARLGLASDLHTCQRGPACLGSDLGFGCAHDSCLAIVMSGAFDDCPGCEQGPWWADCERHGLTTCEHTGSGTGFAGGTVWWADLGCGCQLLDESSDIAAAI